MHFQKNEHYALLFMGELARQSGVERLSLTAISRQHGVSLPFLNKIVRSLRATGLVQSKEGIGGGYTLARKPETISLWEIIYALDTTNREAESVSTVCPVNNACLPQHIRSMVTQSIKERLEGISLQEVAQ
ncbi:Rrf2 family transcriptional regulator [Candidatus Gottesmanbacteria bacterium]|nr:Rrf2 family transcriptional regulator [Candidatus Gottesmanbacteria bacterium]